MQTGYYLGLDIGSNSVGYAVTDENYVIKKFNKKAMWGSHVFEEGKQSAERRIFRASRRRLQRKKQRIQLARELFAKEIAKVDEDFFKRLDESALHRIDKTIDTKYSLFDDIKFNDKSYHNDYPTIHHLIMDLINATESKDIRLVYLAVSYILSNRGHFLIEVDKNDIKNVILFDNVYSSFKDFFSENEVESNWTDDIKDELGKILKKKIGMKEKQKQIKELAFSNKKKLDKSEETIIKAITGAKIKLSDLCDNNIYDDIENNTISFADSDFDEKLASLSEVLEDIDFDLVTRIKAIYDWSVLSNILKEKEFISEAKVEMYKKHKKDLALLKSLVKKYIPKKYYEIFRASAKDLDNYVAYSGNFKSVKNKTTNEKEVEYQKTDNEKFCKYIQKMLKNIDVLDEDKAKFDDLMSRLELKNEFMPKQIHTDNGVIPYQVYRHELKELLENMSNFHTFLKEKDGDGLTIIDKLLSIIEFRIPYYIGPLNDYHKKFSWIKRKADGRILPWNIHEMVDYEQSEEAFIRKMTAKCTYLAGEDVLCKNSLLYCKYMVLNEINNIKISDYPITIECKQHLYKDLFENSQKKITKKRLKDWLVSNNYMQAHDEVRGIDDDIKSSLSSYHKFRKLLTQGILNEAQVENIISRISFTTDKKRLQEYLKTEYPSLIEEDIKYIANMKFKDYGRLSYKLLSGVQATIPETGEYVTLVGALWNTNYNLMQLLSQQFNFYKQIELHNKEYYEQYPTNINTMLEEMYISNAVKRPIYRTLDIVKEIKSIMKNEPIKIFIEMARGEQEKKRTKSRKQQIKDLYDSLDGELKEQNKEIISKLDNEPDDRLKSERYFLYYMQLGRCMYTGEKIDLSKLMDNTYDIDHIYPQSKVKDDSVHNNKVLVLSNANRLKGDIYPINQDIQNARKGFWTMLESKNLITKEKLYRLTRMTGFADEELAGFINRQLVETRQSTKAVARILENIFPNSEIVYVKAGLVSEFRHQFDMLKSREINDLHHAKDAYLNIVIGNVYNVKFTKNPLSFIKSKEKYSINIKEKNGLLSRDIRRNGEIAWIADGTTISQVKKTMSKNNINYVRYAFCRKGGFFDQNPLKAPHKENVLIPRKKQLPTDLYGGYRKPTASFFTIVKHTQKQKEHISFIPVDLLIADKFLKDNNFAMEYCKEKLGLENPVFILNRKKIKINTLLEIDGFRANISATSGGGKQFVLESSTPLVVLPIYEKYIKKIASAIEKSLKNRTELKINEEFDKITKEQNIELYEMLLQKCNLPIYAKLSAYNTLKSTLENGKYKFNSISIEEQVKLLIEVVKYFKTGRKDVCNLSYVGGKKESGRIYLPKVEKLKMNSIEIIDQSPTGLLEKKSGNLLEL